MISQKELLERYNNGENISDLLRSEMNVSKNTENIIERSYDLQAGSYVQLMNDNEFRLKKDKYSARIAQVILEYIKPTRILEAGVGEATTLANVCNTIGNVCPEISAYGFDISWSRVMVANQWLESQNLKNVELSVGGLENIPYLDNSFDVVYTSHSIEPNHGKEREILKELLRVTASKLFLLEPAYEFVDESIKNRMNKHGYCRGLAKIAEDLGYKVIRNEMFDAETTPQNPTSLIIIEKGEERTESADVYACPVSKKPLAFKDNAWFCEQELTVYPQIKGIPYLRKENAIIASLFDQLPN